LSAAIASSLSRCVAAASHPAGLRFEPRQPFGHTNVKAQISRHCRGYVVPSPEVQTLGDPKPEYREGFDFLEANDATDATGPHMQNGIVRIDQIQRAEQYRSQNDCA
jgi:hypothetical protein